MKTQSEGIDSTVTQVETRIKRKLSDFERECVAYGFCDGATFGAELIHNEATQILQLDRQEIRRTK